jgi:dihydroorotate dehydrogenase (fumarate)
MNSRTTWLGLELRNPLIAAASPLTSELDNVRRLEDAGAGAVVLPSLFQEQIEAAEDARSARIDVFADSSPEARSYFPNAVTGPYGVGPDRYLELVRRAKAAVAIPVIASLNGASLAGWIDHARLIQEAGAAALELNLYHLPTDPWESGRDVEARLADIVASVCESIELAVAVKLLPFFSSLGHFAEMLVSRGAKGLVLFNRLIGPEIDPVRMRIGDRLTLSESDEMRTPLLWTALLSGRVGVPLGASGGVSDSTDVVKYLLAGADVVMTASALLRHGTGYMAALVNGLRRWMEVRDIQSLAAMRGIMNWRDAADRGVYARANYLRSLEHYVER